MLISKDDKFFVTGHNGFAGSAVCRKLKEKGYKNTITISRSDLDLRNPKEVEKWFFKNKPDGTPRKKLDISRIHKLGWNPSIKLEERISQEIKNFSKMINS